MESHCTGTGWMPHQLTVTLEKRDWNFVTMTPLITRYSPSSMAYSPDISIYYHQDECEYGTSTTYRLTGTLSAGPRSKWGIGDEAALPCKLF